ncbi:GNAT family N-acetyltransferase [bacterium]|nr:GNAT family N-acetyltransferase [bacterium]
MDIPQGVVKPLRTAADAQRAYCCLTDVPTPWPEALGMCRNWITENLGRRVEGYHLELPGGMVIGHLYYAVSEQALVPYAIEPGVAVLYCEWVQREHQQHGLGRLLFDRFVADLRAQGCKGILVEATDLEGRMHCRHYLARGFEVVQESGHQKLLYLALHQDRVAVRPLESPVQPRSGRPVEILILNGCPCPFEMSTHLLVREVAGEFGDQVVVRQEWVTPAAAPNRTAATGIFINGRRKLGGAATEDAVRQAIREEL